MTESSKKIIENCLEEIKAQNTIFLDLSGLNSFTNFLIITTGTSSRHMSSIKDKLVEDLKLNKIRISGVEGQNSKLVKQNLIKIKKLMSPYLGK